MEGEEEESVEVDHSVNVFTWKTSAQDSTYNEPPTLLEREHTKRIGALNKDGAQQEKIDLLLSVPTVFRWELGGNSVALSGSFSQWQNIPMTKTGDEFFVVINLEEGLHEYKFLVDSQWRHDPKREVTPDVFDGFKNIVRVSLTEATFTDALNADEIKTTQQKDGGQQPMGWMQGVPPVNLMGTMPPAMPPQLLHSVLNDPQTEDNLGDELLEKAEIATPNHVCVNHLYALSIKDSVITVSSTHRFQRKFITTVMYKPIR